MYLTRNSLSSAGSRGEASGDMSESLHEQQIAGLNKAKPSGGAFLAIHSSSAMPRGESP